MKIQKAKLSSFKLTENNPRTIDEEGYKMLKQSMIDFPKMQALRPLVVDEDMTVLGGNMRLRVMLDLGLKEALYLLADDLTEEEKHEFIVKDNISAGKWDFDALANTFEVVQLKTWGFKDYQLGNSALDELHSMVSSGGSDEANGEHAPIEPKITDEGFVRFEVVLSLEAKKEVTKIINDYRNQHGLTQGEALAELINKSNQ